MNRLLFIIILGPLVAYASLLGTERSWEFMQSVGGIAIGEPFEGDAIWELPVSCDVSGIREFTVKPTAINSGLGVGSVNVRIVKHEIWLTVVTRPSGNASCPSVKLGSLSHGKYLVMYLNPDGRKHQIGEVAIGL